MSDTQTQTETTEPSRNVVDRESLDDLRKMLVTQTEAFVADYSKAASTLSAQTDFEKSLPDLRKSSDDPTVRELQTKIDKANDAILEWTKAQDAILVKSQTVLSDEERKALETKRDECKTQVKAAVTFFEGVSEKAGDESVLSDYVPAVADIVKTRATSGGTRSTSGEPGTRRLRVKNIYVQGPAVNPVDSNWAPAGSAEKSTFTNLVSWLEKTTEVKVPTAKLHEAYFTQAGTDDFDRISDTVDFAYSIKGDTYWVRVVKNSD